MKKTTVYLPDDLKKKVEATAEKQQKSEAEFIRDAIASHVKADPPKPRVPLTGKGLGKSIARRVDELLDGFGE